MHKDCIILCHSTNEVGNLLALQKINDRVFISYLTEYLSRFHICKIIFSLSAEAADFKNYILQHRESFSFSFDFSIENEFSGTGTAIQNALQYSDTPDVIIIQGHTFFDVNLEDLMAWQQTKMADVTMALSYQENTKNSLLAHLDDNNFVHQFTEIQSSPTTGLQLTGTYCLFRPSFLNINFPQAFSFENDYLLKYQTERDFIGMISEGYFVDATKAGSIAKATEDFPTLFPDKEGKVISN